MTVVCKNCKKEIEICQACGTPAIPSQTTWQGEGQMFYCAYCSYTFKKGLGGTREGVCWQCEPAVPQTDATQPRPA